MTENEPRLNFRKKLVSKYSIILVIIIGISCLIRFHYFPAEIPLTADALYYFWYSSDIYQIGGLPNNWTPVNNGWSIFVSIFFNMFGSNDIFELMQIQKILSTVISISITIPVYFLCKKFVARKFAIIGASLVAFEPRLMINSFLGITDPLYFLLISSGLVLFLSSNKKLVISSFFVISLATTIRGEGIVFLVGLLILFFIKYKKEKYKIIFKYIIIILIITTILLPVTMYRIDTNGQDPIFSRTISSTNDALSKVTQNGETDWTVNDRVNDRVFDGFKTLIQYLVWISIPNFVIFIPLGIFLIFRKRNFEKNTIIISGGLVLFPALYAYTFPEFPALETRYLFLLFPIFSVFAVLSIERIIGKITKVNLLIVIILLTIVFSSIIFYDYKKIDYDHEKESFEIMKEVSLKVKGVNNLPTESRYLSTIQTINQWPTPYSEMKFNIEIISYQNEENLEDWILESKNKGLTHIMTDGNDKRSNVLKELFFEEMKYPYLEKIYDSRNHGFNYQLKIFEINYKIIESLKDNT
jgi:hypothetical protein